MKHIYSISILCALLLAGPARTLAADETGSDLSTYDYAIYAAPARLQSGSAYALGVNIKNKELICGYQFDVQLPAGFGYTGNDATMSTLRTTPQRTTVFMSNVRTNGNMRVLCGTAAGEQGFLYRLTGNDGEVCTLPIKVDKGVARGRYAVKIYGIILNSLAEDGDIVAHKVADTITTYVTVTGPAFDGLVLNEQADAAPAVKDTTVNVQVIKHLAADEPGTLCLPFAMEAADVARIFGNGVQVYDYNGWEETYANEDDENPTAITVNLKALDPTRGLEANHPYVVQPSVDVDTFELSGVRVHPEGDLTVSTGSKRRHDLGSLVGTYARMAVPAAGLRLQGKTLGYSYGEEVLPAFGAYFDLTDAIQAYYDGRAAGTCTETVPLAFYDENGTPVGTQRVKLRPASGDVYTLDGVLISRQGTRGLPAGIYITRGRKVQVK